MTAHDGCRVSPFRNPRIKALLAAPRGLSRPHASFIGSMCQGIHQTPQTDKQHPARHSNSNSWTTIQKNYNTYANDHKTIYIKPDSITESGEICAAARRETPPCRSRPLSSSQTTTAPATPASHKKDPTRKGADRGGRGAQERHPCCFTRPERAGRFDVPHLQAQRLIINGHCCGLFSVERR